MLTIGGLAREGGVGVETIRYYQRRGLLETPARKQSGSAGGAIRRYGERHRWRLRFIRSAQGAGFTLDEIAELLTLDAGHDRARAREIAQSRIAALDRRIAEAQEARAALARLADACGRSTAGPCPIIAAFEEPDQPA